MQAHLQRPPHRLTSPLKAVPNICQVKAPQTPLSVFRLHLLSLGFHLADNWPIFVVCFPKVHMQILGAANPEAIIAPLLSSPTALINLWALFSLSVKLILHCRHFRVTCLESPPLSPPTIPTSYSRDSFFFSFSIFFFFLHQCWWGGWLGEIRGYGGEIRGEISQHLAAHTHTRPSWETLRSKHGGHERDASTVAKGRRFFLPFFNLAFSLSSSSPLSPSLHLPFFRSSKEVFEKANAATVVSSLPDKGANKTSNRRQTPAATGAVWRERSRKTHYKSNKFFKGSELQRFWLASWGHGFALAVSHTYGSLMSQRS